MKLVLAEKPSVAQSITKVLGANERCDGYLERNGYVVRWCGGYLVELFEPEGYNERYSKWCYDDLPIVPDEWKYHVSPGTRKQFGVLRQLMNRDDVESLKCAEVKFFETISKQDCLNVVDREYISFPFHSLELVLVTGYGCVNIISKRRVYHLCDAFIIHNFRDYIEIFLFLCYHSSIKRLRQISIWRNRGTQKRIFYEKDLFYG